MDKFKGALGVRALAILLILGGVLGIGIACFMAYQFLQVHWVYLILVAALLFLFVWSLVVGVRLWRGEARGWKWATILFGMQVPVLTVPGLTYEYYTGLTIKLMGGKVESPFSFAFGANANFFLDPGITDFVYGVNLFALAAVIYLLTQRSRAISSQSIASAEGG